MATRSTKCRDQEMAVIEGVKKTQILFINITFDLIIKATKDRLFYKQTKKNRVIEH